MKGKFYELLLEELAVFVHGLLTSNHGLAALYNFIKEHYLDSAFHVLALWYSMHSMLSHVISVAELRELDKTQGIAIVKKTLRALPAATVVAVGMLLILAARKKLGEKKSYLTLQAAEKKPHLALQVA